MRLLVVHARACDQVARDRAHHAGPQAALAGNHEERRRLHLDVEQPESGHLLGPRRGLGVERVVGHVEAGVDAEVVLRTDDAGGADQGLRQLQVGHGRVALRDVCVARAVVAERALAHDQVARLDARLQRRGAPDPDERRHADAGQLLDRDGRRRAAHPGRRHRDLPAAVRADHRPVLALVGDLACVLEMLRDERHPERVAGQERDGAHLAGRDVDVELPRADPGAALVDDGHATLRGAGWNVAILSGGSDAMAATR